MPKKPSGRIEHPALHHLERNGCPDARWEPAAADQKREFNYYRLTSAAKKQPAKAIARVMWPAEEA